MRIPLLILPLALLVGCASYSPEQAQKDLSLLGELKTTLVKERDALPKTDPLVETLNKRIAEIEKAQAVVDAVQQTADSGNVSPAARDTLMGLPYGKYILLTLSLGGLALREYRKRQAERALRQVVSAVEMHKTEALKAALAASLDEDAKALVSAERAKLPPVEAVNLTPTVVTK
jgi:hypothetical protein